MDKNNLYLEWFGKGDDDELNAASILKHRDGTPNGVCFFAQQIAEKYLKGLLVYKNIEFPKTHDLVQLVTLLLPAYPEASSLSGEADLLSRYYVKVRYPDDSPERTWEEAEKVFASATSIKNFVISKIPS